MPSELRDPTVSVIVTNRNYGHFLGDCLDSVLAQTFAADAVIVIDDASSDGSESVLARYAGRVEVVEGGGRGQAAAFNRGFGRATGDIVLFLDADDLLRPEAIEMVVAQHAPDMALLAFGLETIDACGRSTGAYSFPLEADEGDNRPRLLRPGSLGAGFTFAPTSGNAFSRWFLERALPMPEEPWRICADAYLVRAAALLGRIGALRQVLGGYRVHGGNGYVRADTLDPWSMQRGFRDLQISVDALLSAADCPRLLGDERDAALIRLALRRRAIETLKVMADWSGDDSALVRERRRATFAVLADSLAIDQRLAAATLLGRVGSRVRPPGLAALEARLAALERPRWPVSLPFGRNINFAERGPHTNMLAEGWAGDTHQRQCRSHGSAALLEFLLEAAAAPVFVEMGVSVPEPWRGAGLRFTVDGEGRRLWSGEVRERGVLSFTLDRDPYAPEQLVRLRIGCAGLEEGSGSASPFFVLEWVMARERPASPVNPLLEPGIAVRAADLLRAEPEHWELCDDARLAAPEGRLRFSLAPVAGRPALVLELAPPAPRGWLTVSCEGTTLFSGETGATSRLELPLQEPTGTAVRRFELSLAFSPTSEPEARLVLRSVGLVARNRLADLYAGLRHRRPDGAVLNLGQIVHLGGRSELPFLGSGWHEPGPEGVRNRAAEAVLLFRVPDGARGLRLRLGFRPVLPTVVEARHLVGLSAGGTILQALELESEGEVGIELPAGIAENGKITLGLHSVYMGGGEQVASLGLATLELTSIALDGEAEAAALPMPAAPGYARPALLALLDGLDRTEETGLDELLGTRAALAEALLACDSRGLELLLQGDRLARLERLGALTAGAPLAPAEAEAADRATEPPRGDSAGEDALRSFLLGMLLLPAFRLPGAADVEGLPAVLVRNPEPVAAYLGREPELEGAEDVTAYIAHLERLLAGIDRVLDRADSGSARHRLAVRALQDLRNTKALFGGDNLLRLIRRRSRLIEKLLGRAGAVLPMPATPRPGARRLRLGVLVRSLRPSPEAWLLLGMCRHVDRTRAELVLVTTDGEDVTVPGADFFDRTLCLAGQAVDEAVAAIRALDLDLFVLGAYVANWERVSAIVAHRLARIQVTACWNCPSTIGFRSFDIALAWAGLDPEDLQAEHAERVELVAAPVQGCLGGLPDRPAEPKDALRRELGLPQDAVLLTSGAMAHKILPELMQVWAEILARAPAAVLVLYPFAPNWAMRFSAGLFRRRFEAALAAEGVAPERVLILDEQPHEQVWRILAASDLYLDSFPYTGATTVCEAFACGLPVVTLEGRMLRQRTGATWVRAYGLPELIVATPEDYVACAVRLATDPAARAAAAAQVESILAGTPPHADSVRFGSVFSDALWRIAEESGLFPGLAPELEFAPAPAEPPAAPRAARPSPARTVRVAIVTTPRTGSTLLTVVLGRCAGAEMHYELFHTDAIQYRRETVTDPEALKARDADPLGFADRMFAEAERRGASLVGLKLFIYRDRHVIRYLMRDPRVRIICLRRSNVLAQYASQRIAAATGTWALTEGPPRVYPKIAFDAADFRRFEQGETRNAAEIAALLSEAGREALFVEYNDIIKPATVLRLSRFLGVPVPTPDRIAMHRQNAPRAIDRFSNPEAVSSYLAQVGRAQWADGR